MNDRIVNNAMGSRIGLRSQVGTRLAVYRLTVFAAEIEVHDDAMQAYVDEADKAIRKALTQLEIDFNIICDLEV